MGILPQIADLLLLRDAEDQDCRAIPKEPDRHEMRLAVGAHRSQPENLVVAQPLVCMCVARRGGVGHQGLLFYVAAWASKMISKISLREVYHSAVVKAWQRAGEPSHPQWGTPPWPVK